MSGFDNDRVAGQQQESEWIANSGTSYDTPEGVSGATVEVKFRSGGTARDIADTWYWFDDGDDCDIIAYRVVRA